MSEEDLIESVRSTHGLDRHVCVHEAGHAVAAIDNAIPFRAVVFYGDADAPQFMAGLAKAAAAIDPGPDPAAWVLPDPLGSLRFVLGGVAAEHAVLGDSIPGGWVQDVKVWRRGSGALETLTEEDLAEFLGRPMLEVWRESGEWAVANATRIEAVAAALAGHEPPWEMTQQQVRDVLGGL